jgi:hypothetical protein
VSEETVMADQSDEAMTAVIEAGAELLGFELEQEWMPAILANLRVTFRHGALVAEFALPDEAEAAPVFRA